MKKEYFRLLNVTLEISSTHNTFFLFKWYSIEKGKIKSCIMFTNLDYLFFNEFFFCILDTTSVPLPRCWCRTSTTTLPSSAAPWPSASPPRASARCPSTSPWTTPTTGLPATDLLSRWYRRTGRGWPSCSAPLVRKSLLGVIYILNLFYWTMIIVAIWNY